MKILRSLIGSLALTVGFSAVAMASEPYNSYYYNNKLEAVPSVAGFKPKELIEGVTSGVGKFINPSDIVVKNKKIYVCDSGNNRILIYGIKKDETKFELVLDTFKNGEKDDTFKNPTGLFVHSNGDLYIADSENSRVVVLDSNLNLVRIIDRPEIDVMADDYLFTPQKVGVDINDRVYIVAKGMTEGLVQTNIDGEFLRFFGSNKVIPDMKEIFLRQFMTDEQRAKRKLFIPTEFSNIDIDDKGFVYTTVLRASEEQVKKLNYVGTNIMRTTGYTGKVYGDIGIEETVMIDVATDKNGNMYALDQNSGKIFQYNSLGEMLTVFGGTGDFTGLFKNAVAIDCDENGDIYVLDAAKSSITVFGVTEFGQKIMDASNSYMEGNYIASMEEWQEVLNMNANYDLAYVGIGNAHLQLKQYEEAMENFKIVRHSNGYSKAFDKHRTEVLRSLFPIIMTTLLILVAILILLRKKISNGIKKFNKFIDA